jgi:predicted DCC family thiol-disulfide oxidoreductase YuxK
MPGRNMTQAHHNDRQNAGTGQFLIFHSGGQYTRLNAQNTTATRANKPHTACKISIFIPEMKNKPSDSIPDPLVVFDGHCILCNRALQFYLDRLEPQTRSPNPHRDEAHTYYTAAQSPWAQRILPDKVLQEAQHAILIHRNNQWLSGPTALWPLIRRMTYPWRLLLILRVLPGPLTRGLYRHIAQRRYRWFGTRESCTRFEPPAGHRLLHD